MQRFKKAIAVMLVLCLSITVFSACPTTIAQTTDLQIDQTEQITPEQAMLLANSYSETTETFTNATTNVANVAVKWAPVWTSPTFETLPSGKTIKIIHREYDYYYIQYDIGGVTKRGYVPRSCTSTVVSTWCNHTVYNPGENSTLSSQNVYYCPNSTSEVSDTIDVDEGEAENKPLIVLSRYGDYYYIQYVNNPDGGGAHMQWKRGWVPTQSIIVREPVSVFSPENKTTFYIQNVGTGRFLTLEDPNAANKSNLSIYDFEGSDRQKWTIETSNSSGTNAIYVQLKTNVNYPQSNVQTTGKVMSIKDSLSVINTRMEIRNDSANPAKDQEFYIKPSGITSEDGSIEYNICSRLTGNYMQLGVYADQQGNGGPVLNKYPYTTWYNRWRLIPVRYEYAYSIGHDFGDNNPFDNDDYAGDFTENVNYASTVYGMLGYVSYYNYNPDYNYLRGDNPAGNDRLGSSIVFLNGHASYANLWCGDTVDDAEHKCGVHKDTDFTSSVTGYTYAGLKNRDLSDVKLISFVGCNTASNTDNLCTSAIDRGAECAIGFTDGIESRTADGKNWLTYYHNALGNGSSIEEAIDVATISAPNSDLGDDIKTFGNPEINILLDSFTTPNTSINSISSYEKFCNVIDNSKTTNCQISVDTDDIEKTAGKFDFNSVTTKEYVDLSRFKTQYQDIISIMTNHNPEFDISDYKVLANEYADNTGVIKLRYYIDNVQTSAVTVFKIKDGTIDFVSYANDLTNYQEVNKANIISAKNEYTPQIDTTVLTNRANKDNDDITIEEQYGYYYYNFEEETLYYIVDTVYSLNKFENVSSIHTEKHTVTSATKKK